MKKFIGKVLLMAAFIAVFTVGFSAVVDPYNVFHWANLQDNGVEPNKNYIKMNYILANPDKFDAFMFGSSRVGSIHVEKITDVTCYNMTYSQGVPAEHLANLQTMIDAGIVPQRVYVGVDNLSYTYDPAVHDTEPVRSSYEYLKAHPLAFVKMYMNTALVFESLETSIGHTKTEGYAENFYTYGAWNYYGGATLADAAGPLTPSVGTDMRMEETLSEIRQIADLCEANGIELILFTNPMVDLTYEAALDQDYLEFLDQLAQVHPYYNFSGLNAITTDHTNFVDTSHYSAFVGDMILDAFDGTVDSDLYAQGFGVYVTEENVDDLLDTLK